MHGDAFGWCQTEALDPLAAALEAEPVTQIAGDITCNLDMGHDFGVGPRCCRLPRCHLQVRLCRDWGAGRSGGGGLPAEAQDLETRCRVLVFLLIDRDQDLRRTVRDPDQRGGAVQPSIFTEGADADRLRTAGETGCRGDPNTRQTGGLIGGRAARGLEDAEQPGLQRHQVGGDLQFRDPAGCIGRRIACPGLSGLWLSGLFDGCNGRIRLCSGAFRTRGFGHAADSLLGFWGHFSTYMT